MESGSDFRRALAKKKIPGIVFWSRLLWLPDPNIDLVTVVGDPIEIPHVAHPTADQVDKCHANFVAALQSIFDTYKADYAGSPHATIHIH